MFNWNTSLLNEQVLCHYPLWVWNAKSTVPLGNCFSPLRPTMSKPIKDAYLSSMLHSTCSSGTFALASCSRHGSFCHSFYEPFVYNHPAFLRTAHTACVPEHFVVKEATVNDTTLPIRGPRSRTTSKQAPQIARFAPFAIRGKTRNCATYIPNRNRRTLPQVIYSQSSGFTTATTTPPLRATL